MNGGAGNLENIREKIKIDLVGFIIQKGFSINDNALSILIDAEMACYERNINLFKSDVLLPLVVRFNELNNIIDKYGGDCKAAIEVLENRLDEASEYGARDEYNSNKLLWRDNTGEWPSIIENCMKQAKINKRNEINESDITLAILDIHDEEEPLYDNATFSDMRLHTPYNTLSHLISEYSKSLWVKFDDVRWELTHFNKKNYDIAISFAGEDRAIAEEIAEKLSNLGKRVFYDKFEQANLWGKDLYTYFSEIYGDRAKYCLMVVSKNYAEKHWTNLERKAAQAKAFRENQEYILPLRIDDTEIPGVLSTTGYIDIRKTDINEIINLIMEKI